MKGLMLYYLLLFSFSLGVIIGAIIWKILEALK